MSLTEGRGDLDKETEAQRGAATYLESHSKARTDHSLLPPQLGTDSRVSPI